MSGSDEIGVDPDRGRRAARVHAARRRKRREHPASDIRREPVRPGQAGWLRRQHRAWAATGLLLACAAAACSSATPIPSATGSQAAQFRLSDAPALLVQCMLNQGTLGRSDSIFSGPPAWLRDGSIVITPTTVVKFDTWYQVNGAITVAGKDLTEWAKWAAANDELPSGVCGTSISARALQKQVFGKDPAAGDPWGA